MPVVWSRRQVLSSRGETTSALQLHFKRLVTNNEITVSKREALFSAKTAMSHWSLDGPPCLRLTWHRVPESRSVRLLDRARSEAT